MQSKIFGGVCLLRLPFSTFALQFFDIGIFKKYDFDFSLRFIAQHLLNLAQL